MLYSATAFWGYQNAEPRRLENLTFQSLYFKIKNAFLGLESCSVFQRTGCSFLEDPGWAPSTHMVLTKICDSSSRKSAMLFWPLLSLGTHVVHIHFMYAGKHKIKISLKKKTLPTAFLTLGDGSMGTYCESRRTGVLGVWEGSSDKRGLVPILILSFTSRAHMVGRKNQVHKSSDLHQHLLLVTCNPLTLLPPFSTKKCNLKLFKEDLSSNPNHPHENTGTALYVLLTWMLGQKNRKIPGACWPPS